MACTKLIFVAAVSAYVAGTSACSQPGRSPAQVNAETRTTPPSGREVHFAASRSTSANAAWPGGAAPREDISGSGSQSWRNAATSMQTTVRGRLAGQPLLSGATDFSGRVALWVDEVGRISRVELTEPTGNSTTDQAIVKTLQGLELPEPLPRDLPMPIHMRLAGRNEP